MSAQEVSEITPNLSEPTPEQSQNIMQERIDEVSVLTDDEKMKCATWFLTIELMKQWPTSFMKSYVTPWLKTKNYEQELDPKVITYYSIEEQCSSKKVIVCAMCKILINI